MENEKAKNKWDKATGEEGGNRLCLLTILSLLNKNDVGRKHEMVQDSVLLHVIII